MIKHVELRLARFKRSCRCFVCTADEYLLSLLFYCLIHLKTSHDTLLECLLILPERTWWSGFWTSFSDTFPANVPWGLLQHWRLPLLSLWRLSSLSCLKTQLCPSFFLQRPRPWQCKTHWMEMLVPDSSGASSFFNTSFVFVFGLNLSEDILYCKFTCASFLYEERRCYIFRAVMFSYLCWILLMQVTWF